MDIISLIHLTMPVNHASFTEI